MQNIVKFVGVLAIVGLLIFGAGIVFVESKPQATSAVYNWADLVPEIAGTREKRPIMAQASATAEMVTIHASTLPPKTPSHEPHAHQEEEIVVVKEGKLEIMISGKTQIAEKGGVVFFASGDLHGIKNIGDAPASYYIIKWFEKGTVPNTD